MNLEFGVKYSQAVTPLTLYPVLSAKLRQGAKARGQVCHWPLVTCQLIVAGCEPLHT